MSKAEDLAMGLFPLLETDKIGNNPYISYNTEQLAKQEGFIRGYHQAEKGLKLTWKDMELIYEISCDVFNEQDGHFYNTSKIWKEVLERFNDNRKK